MFGIAAISVALAVTVQILEKHDLKTVQVRQDREVTEIRAPLDEPVTLERLDILVPGKGWRSYPGTITITSSHGRLHLSNVVDEDTYIEGVLTGEAEAGSLEALRALAVAARSMLPFLKGRHKAADACDLTHCQVYSGVSESTVIAEAVRTTRGCVLMTKGKVALTPYHSTCGGTTSPADGFFDVQAPHLRGVRDDGLCSLSPHFHWELTLEPATIAKVFGIPGSVTDLHVTQRDPTGRVRWLTANRRRLSGTEFYRRAGQALGWNVIKSTLFSVDREGARYRIRGRGLGHGVGLCQWGAEAMARRGHTFEEILAFYFPGIRVNCAATSGEISK